MRMTRRRLLGGTIGGVAVAGAGAAAWNLRPSNTVRLLFTNDMHSHLRPVYHRGSGWSSPAAAAPDRSGVRAKGT